MRKNLKFKEVYVFGGLERVLGYTERIFAMAGLTELPPLTRTTTYFT